MACGANIFTLSWRSYCSNSKNANIYTVFHIHGRDDNNSLVYRKYSNIWSYQTDFQKNILFCSSMFCGINNINSFYD